MYRCGNQCTRSITATPARQSPVIAIQMVVTCQHRAIFSLSVTGDLPGDTLVACGINIVVLVVASHLAPGGLEEA